jgi:hypothetical protein
MLIFFARTQREHT